MKWWVALLILLLILLQYQYWFGNGGVISAWKLSDHVSVQDSLNHQLKVRNDAIAADIADLKSGAFAIEERAREKLGMVKKGESFYEVIQEKHS